MNVGVAGDASDEAAIQDASVDAGAESDARADASEASSEAGAEAGCVPGATASCYSGPAGTQGVGTCVAGVETCGATSTWGPCIGEVDPAPDVCGGPDSNCDGKLPPQQCPGDVTAKFPLFSKGVGGGSLAVDPTTGHVILVGLFDQSIDFGMGPLTSPYAYAGAAFMLTLDSTLTPIAQAVLGGSNYIDVHTDASGNRAIHMSVYQGDSADLGGGTIAGPADLTAMLDEKGTTLLWQKSIPSPSTNANFTAHVHAAVNQRANMWVSELVPDYGCAHEVDASTTQSVLVELGPGATCEWETNLTASVGVMSMAARSDGSTAMFGTYDGKVPATLGPLTLKPGSPRALLFVVDSNGVVTWADALDEGLVFTNSPGVNASAVAVGPGDEIYFAGSSGASSLDLGGGPMPLQATPPGNDDFVVARFDPKGSYVWAKRIAGNATGTNMKWLGAGPTAIFIAGGTNAGNVDFGGGPLGPSFLVSLDLDGNHRWSVSEYTDSVDFGAVAGTSFVYALTDAGNLWQFLY
jgi:hypothetical protein